DRLALYERRELREAICEPEERAKEAEDDERREHGAQKTVAAEEFVGRVLYQLAHVEAALVPARDENRLDVTRDRGAAVHAPRLEKVRDGGARVFIARQNRVRFTFAG